MTFCHSCDKIINHNFIKKHNKPKTHLYFYNNFVINKYYIGDVLWKNFQNIIRDYMNEYNSKFYSFSMLVKFQLNEENISISIEVSMERYHYINLKRVVGYIINIVRVKK